MPEFEITFASRHVRRQFEKAMGGSLLKVLTELITNSDDSYRRMTARGEAGTEGFGDVIIEFDRVSRHVAVVDRAEGLTDEQMQDRFAVYGQESGDRRLGLRTRSLFGKGLRDVLFTQERSQVESIRDGSAYLCKFRWRTKAGGDRPIVETLPGPRVEPKLRASWGIPGNGTRVQFTLREGVSVPQYAKLERDLQSFYMLRNVLADPTRRVILRTRVKGLWEDRPLRYAAPAEAASTALGADAWKVEWDGHVIQAFADLRAYESDLYQGEVGLDERDGGLLVVDEDDAVLDLTLFGFDTDPAAAPLYGTLRLDGVGELIREKLNEAHPEELLTETRDGFDKRTPFYRVLRDSVDVWLRPIVDKERKRRAGAPKLSDATRKRHDRAFEQLNGLYRRLLGESVGGGTGTSTVPLETDLPLEFRWSRVVVRRGGESSVQLLVNTSLVPAGSRVTLATTSAGTVALPNGELTVPSPRVGIATIVLAPKVEGVAVGEATVTAHHGEAHADLACSVVDEDVPELTTGLGFLPDMLEVKDGDRGRTHLFADLAIVGDVGGVVLTSSNPQIEVIASPLGWEALTRTVVRASVTVIGRGKGEEAFISASLGGVEAIAYVRVVSRKTRPTRQGGRFKGYDFRTLDRKVQATLDKEGTVVINLADPTNRLYFGADADAASRAVEGSTTSQTLLAELVIGECLQMAVSEAYSKGKLKNRLDPVTDIRNYVSEQRYDLGAEIHRLFVKDLPSGE